MRNGENIGEVDCRMKLNVSATLLPRRILCKRVVLELERGELTPEQKYFPVTKNERKNGKGVSLYKGVSGGETPVLLHCLPRPIRLLPIQLPFSSVSNDPGNSGSR